MSGHDPGCFAQHLGDCAVSGFVRPAPEAMSEQWDRLVAEGRIHFWREVHVAKMDTPHGLSTVECTCGWRSKGLFQAGTKSARLAGEQHCASKPLR